ncbi:hypothetical protein ILYODFUR_032954 [Ilyodon furcidens]|uniref:Uncharacterized protein n=1 Tax=Ilyodon furcidens TaxID=33524 RepID=A0ABV0V843_9TELE
MDGGMDNKQKDILNLKTSELIQLLLSCVTSLTNTLRATGSHARPSHHTASTVFNRWCGVLWIMSCSTPTPYFFLAIILEEVDLGFICLNNVLPEICWLL